MRSAKIVLGVILSAGIAADVKAFAQRMVTDHTGAVPSDDGSPDTAAAETVRNRHFRAKSLLREAGARVTRFAAS